jgi:membrane fusion protein, heavy metal efflux system
MKNFCTILFVLSLAACTPEPRLENTPAARADVNTVMLTSEQLKNGGIVTGYAGRKNLTRAIQVSGSIEAPPGNIISVSFPFGGYVRRMNLLPGTQVKRGEILATLEDPQYIQLQQDYLTAKNRLSFLASEHSRQKELNADKTTSDKSYQ